MFATHLDLLPSMLAIGIEEVRMALNCLEYKLGVSSSSVALHSVVVKKKKKETKGSIVIRWLKKILGLCLMSWTRSKAIWVIFYWFLSHCRA
jgi:hypothetical protein